ncbi:hypothetical protein ACFLTE_05105 [Bacteroidota bacterium]
MRKLLLILIIFILSFNIYSQEYYQSVGARGSITSGITYKKFLNEMKAMEAIMSFRKSGIQVTALRQYHELTLYKHSDNYYFIHGYGGHVGFIYAHKDEFLLFNRVLKEDGRGFAPVVGLDAYLGLEYRMDQLPFIIGFDYKPFIEFSLLPFKMNLWDFSFFIKYTFN